MGRRTNQKKKEFRKQTKKKNIKIKLINIQHHKVVFFISFFFLCCHFQKVATTDDIQDWLQVGELFMFLFHMSLAFKNLALV